MKKIMYRVIDGFIDIIISFICCIILIKIWDLDLNAYQIIIIVGLQILLIKSYEIKKYE